MQTIVQPTMFDLNLRHLRAVPSLVAAGNMGRAAAAANLSQPALTQGIAKLERLLGTPLFDRQSDGTRPTAAGRQFAGRVMAALAHLARGARRSGRQGFAQPDRLMTATQLRAFLAVADHGGFAGAAVATGQSQPAIHRAVRDLEQISGQVLVERSGRGTVLTEAGRRLARGTRLAAGEVAAAIAELGGDGGDHARLRVGAMPLSRALVVPIAIARFTRLFPRALVEVVEGSWRELMEPLRDGRVDLAVGAMRDGQPDGLEQTPLFHDRLHIIARAGHPLAGPAMPDAAALAAYPWIVSQPGTPLRTHWDSLFPRERPPAPVECGSVMVIRGILRESDHLTILSYDQVALEVEAGVLATVGPPPPGAVRRIGLVTRTGWRPTPAQARFIDLLEEAARESENAQTSGN